MDRLDHEGGLGREGEQGDGDHRCLEWCRLFRHELKVEQDELHGLDYNSDCCRKHWHS